LFGIGKSGNKDTAVCVPPGSDVTQKCDAKTKAPSSSILFSQNPKVNGNFVAVADSWDAFAICFNASCSKTTFGESAAAQCQECNIMRKRVAALNEVHAGSCDGEGHHAMRTMLASLVRLLF
jgi:hypothetical protein